MITFKKNESKQLSKHFNSKEFECPCSVCDIQKISSKLLEKLEIVRETYGRAIRITSGYRCLDHNKAVGGKENSSHMDGIAVDITPQLLNVDELDALYEVCYNVFDNIGDGRSKHFIHVDDRDPKPTGKRHWVY